MDLGIKGKVALVTASSQGIGFGCAKALASEGARICLSSRNQENLRAAEAKIRDELDKPEIITITCDMRHPEQIRKLCKQVRERLGEPDILINNTGGPKPGSLFELSEKDWEEGFRLLTLSTVTLYRELIPAMRQKKWGRIVNITSVSSRQPVTGLTLSNSFRPGLLGFAKTVADEVAAEGVLINTIMPGITRTARMEELSRKDPERIIESLRKMVPMRRAGEPDELGAMAAFLCSEKASFITGTAIAVDGGIIRCV